MPKVTKHDSREAIGCFVMLIFGAMIALGGMVVVVPNAIMRLLGKDVAGFWRSVLLWVVVPLAGIGLTALFTYGRSGILRGPRRGG